MKITYHIPTEQFGFVEIEKEGELLASYEEVKAELISENVSGEGLSDKEFNIALDGYMELKTLPSELYEKMNKEQQNVLQQLKKHYKRINYKNGN